MKNIMNDISVVIPTFKENSYLGKTLSSLADQTFANKIEILVCEFNPDKTIFGRRIVEAFHNDFPKIPIRLIEIQRPGIAFARNEGILRSNGRIIVNFDADARFSHRSGLEMMVTPILTQDAVCTICDNEFDLTQLPNDKLVDMDAPITILNGLNSLQKIANTAILEPGSTIRKDVYIEIGGFPDVERWELLQTSQRLFYKYPLRTKHVPGVSVMVSPRRALKLKELGTSTLDYNLAVRSDEIEKVG